MEKTAFERKDLIPGGLADNKSYKDFPPKKVREGQRVEMEHTNSKAVAREIASDHLTEDPNYYEKLKTIEKKANITAFFDELEKIAMTTPEALKAVAGTDLGRNAIIGAFVGGLTAAHAGLMDQTPVYDQWSGGMRNPNAVDSLKRAVRRGAKGAVIGGGVGAGGGLLLKAVGKKE
jgi:hypothetical protein